MATTARCCTWGWSCRKRKLWAPSRCLNSGLARPCLPISARTPRRGDGSPLLPRLPQSGRSHPQGNRDRAMELQHKTAATAERSDPARFGTARKTSDRSSRLTIWYRHRPKANHLAVHQYACAGPCSLQGSATLTTALLVTPVFPCAPAAFAAWLLSPDGVYPRANPCENLTNTA